MPGRGVQDPQQAGPGHARAGGDSEGCQVAAAFPLFPRGELVLRGGMGRGTCGQFPEGSLLLEGAWPCGHGGELLPAPRHPSHSGSANGKLGEAQGLSLAETCGDAPPLVQSSVHRGFAGRKLSTSLEAILSPCLCLQGLRHLVRSGPGLFAQVDPATPGPGSTTSWRRVSEHPQCTEKHKEAILSV